MDTLYEHDRMDDDGAPPRRIGIAPTPAEDTPAVPERRNRTGADLLREERARSEPRNPSDQDGPRLDGMDVAGPTSKEGDPPKLALILPGQTESPAILDARGEETSSLRWPDYLAWRKTKCKPRDLRRDAIPFGPVSAPEAFREAWPRQEWIEEIDQATHEFVGEVAELVELFVEHGPNVFYGDLRAKLIDECGDIYFCGAWALDAWGVNPLDRADDLEIVRVADDDPLAAFAQILATKPRDEVFGNGRFMAVLGNACINTMLAASMLAGLTANSFKKLKFQRREQDVETQVGRICTAFFHVNQILIIANSSVEEALRSNRRKLDARFPDGYRPGVGGGIRTGEGK